MKWNEKVFLFQKEVTMIVKELAEHIGLDIQGQLCEGQQSKI